MSISGSIYIGIDPFSQQGSFTYSKLDEECNLISLDYGEISEISQLIPPDEQVYIAVNGPRNTNLGFAMEELVAKGLKPGQLRGGDLRIAEKLIREKGINISATPSKKELCPEWMHLSFLIFEELEKINFSAFPTTNCDRQYLETHSQAFFCTLLEQTPLPKSNIEGRLQRQLILFDLGVGIHNPMTFFEEITHHKLINGILPFDLVYASEQLDSIAAAYTAFLAATQPKHISMVGSDDEGFIILPHKTM
ncbi:hypothetical protein ACFLXB_07695 [Chloroflexota bacterium]